MNKVQIEQLCIPETIDGQDSADFLRAVEVFRQVRIATWGSDDLAYTGEEMLALCHDPYERYIVLVARLGTEIIGRAGIAMPLDDDTEVAHVTLDVLPTAQGHGVGRNLLEAAEAFVLGENRRVVVVETDHSATQLAGPEEEMIRAANGVGGLPLGNRQARFAFNSGYVLEQVEQFGSCQLPLEPGMIDDLSQEARNAHHDAYVVHQWMDRCPSEWVEDIVRLERDLVPESVDSGTWDAGKLRESEELSLSTGRHTVVSTAECLATGKLVAYTSISVLGHGKDVVFQDETVVESEHHGNELGLAIKVANFQFLAREFPAARTIYAWNAAENSYMRSVNARLGFTTAGVTGQWQKDFAETL